MHDKLKELESLLERECPKYENDCTKYLYNEDCDEIYKNHTKHRKVIEMPLRSYSKDVRPKKEDKIMMTIKVNYKDNYRITRINGTLEEIAKYYIPCSKVESIKISEGGGYGDEYIRRIPSKIYRVGEEKYMCAMSQSPTNKIKIEETIRNRKETHYGIYSDICSVLDNFATAELANYYMILHRRQSNKDCLQCKITVPEVVLNFSTFIFPQPEPFGTAASLRRHARQSMS